MHNKPNPSSSYTSRVTGVDAKYEGPFSSAGMDGRYEQAHVAISVSM
jgi:hypothetical protein